MEVKAVISETKSRRFDPLQSLLSFTAPHFVLSVLSAFLSLGCLHGTEYNITITITYTQPFPTDTIAGSEEPFTLSSVRPSVRPIARQILLVSTA